MVKIAFAGFGEVNTPEDVIIKKCKKAAEDLKGLGGDLIECFPIADDYEEKGVEKAAAAFDGKQFDALVVCVAGWIPSHTVIKITERYKHIPMVLWGLCGWTEGDRLVTTADQAGTSALRKTFFDLGYSFIYVYDIIGEKSNAQRVYNFCRAAHAARALRSQKIGHMGYRDMHLYNTLFDGASLKRDIGTEIECFEMLEVVQRADKISDGEKAKVVDEKMLAKWKFLKEADYNVLKAAAGYYLALKQIIDERKYVAVSLKDVDGMKKLLGFPPAPIFMLLANEEKICTIPENDALGNVTQSLVKAATGQIGAYLEFYEYFKEGVLAGVPDYIPEEITDGQVTVMPAAFGALSQGILNVSKAKTGELTMCRLCYTDGKYYMHMVKGKGKTPRKWEECGWAQPAPQLPGLEIELENTEKFTQNIMGQHYIISYGDNTEIIGYVCKILGVEVIC